VGLVFFGEGRLVLDLGVAARAEVPGPPVGTSHGEGGSGLQLPGPPEEGTRREAVRTPALHTF
jgi:hypothetical protein